MISIRSRALAALALVCVAGAVSAQPPPVVQQVLKDVWVATDDSALFEATYAEDSTSALVGVPGDYTVGSARALAFEPPQLGSGAVRDLIAVEGNLLRRFSRDGATAPLFDAGAGLPDLTLVNAVAVADDGTVLFSGFARRKRVYELWALNPQTLEVRLRATGTPQLTDAVYVGAEDAAAAALPGGGGLLAATAKAIMYFRKPAGGWMSNAPADNPAPLRDATSLGLKGSTQLLSVDLVRTTRVLMLATSDRALLVTAGGAPTTFVAALPKPATCTSKTQRLLVRNARGGSDAAIVVSDLCGQVLRYDFMTTSTTVSAPYDTEVTSAVAGLVALAVGEGNVVTCQAGVSCALTNGFDAELPTTEELLVRQFANLCDPRVAGCGATGVVDANNVLSLNSLLPQAVQDALKFNPAIASDDVNITIPPYMFAAGPAGRFGILIVQGDDAGAAGQVTVELEIDELLGFELGTRSTGNTEYPPFVRGAAATTPLALLNQDIVAYAPDNPTLPTVANYPTPGVRGFEATPVTTGSYNPLVGGLRGFSVVIYGLQHDLSSAQDRPRGVNGGLPSLVAGSQRLCNLSVGSQQYIAFDTPQRFFANLAACLLVDQKALLSNVIPGFVLTPPARSALLSRLANVEDKLIKALLATGPNSGSTDFQAVLSQLDNYDAQVRGTTFTSYTVYKNELLVRSEAFRFNLMERTLPSIPIGGFPLLP